MACRHMARRERERLHKLRLKGHEPLVASSGTFVFNAQKRALQTATAHALLAHDTSLHSTAHEPQHMQPSAAWTLPAHFGAPISHLRSTGHLHTSSTQCYTGVRLLKPQMLTAAHVPHGQAAHTIHPSAGDGILHARPGAKCFLFSTALNDHACYGNVAG